jgi:hypothetical protein
MLVTLNSLAMAPRLKILLPTGFSNTTGLPEEAARATMFPPPMGSLTFLDSLAKSLSSPRDFLSAALWPGRTK